jgi:protein phosphatase PTC7
MIPRRMRELYGPMSDSPNDAHLSCHTMQHGDIVIFATDGVWDNVTNQDILRTVTSEMTASGAWAIEEGKGITATITSGPEIEGVAEKISKALVAKAKSLSTNNKIDGPFAREVQRLFPNETYRGGKVDDITVLVVGVRELALEAVPKL